MPIDSPVTRPSGRSATVSPLLTGFAAASHDGDVNHFCSGSPTGCDQEAVPDYSVEASSTSVAEAVDSSLWVYSRTGVVQAETDLESVIGGSHACSGDRPLGDFRVEYDSSANRWYLAALGYFVAQPPDYGVCGVLMASTGASGCGSISISPACCCAYAFHGCRALRT